MLYRLFLGSIASCCCWFGGLPVTAIEASTDTRSPTLEQLSTTDHTSLENGAVLVSEVDGNYIARVLIEASAAEVWAVLTDYANFPDFIPNVVESEVIESGENRSVVEQVSEQQVFLVTVKSRLRTEQIETENQRIDFRLVSGDLDELEGYWLIEPIANSTSEASPADSQKVLLSHVVTVKPKRGTPVNLFHNLFQDVLQETLAAIRQEVQQRQNE
jgi:ribosome-associated toxin RatA of RatAB toxin-antitoxin module